MKAGLIWAVACNSVNPSDPERDGRYWGGRRIKTVFALYLLQYIRDD